MTTSGTFLTQFKFFRCPMYRKMGHIGLRAVLGNCHGIFVENAVCRNWMVSGIDQSRFLGNTFLRNTLCSWLHPPCGWTELSSVSFLREQVFMVQGVMGVGVGAFIPKPNILCEVLGGNGCLIPSNSNKLTSLKTSKGTSKTNHGESRCSQSLERWNKQQQKTATVLLPLVGKPDNKGPLCLMMTMHSDFFLTVKVLWNAQF